MGSVKKNACPYLKNPTNMTVSIYKNSTDTEGRNVDLFKILTTAKWQHLTDKVRAETNKAKRDKLKQQLLPAFTPSGVFRKDERNNEGLVKHSGYMCIDIDGDDNPTIKDWQSVVFELGKLPQIAFAGLSASGNGVFAIIPIKYPDKHKEHFEAFQKSFAKRGLVIDPKCGNVSRLRFYSYNNKYYINKEAEPYMHLYTEPRKSMQTSAHYKTTVQSGESDVDALVRKIVAMGVNIVPDYDSWFNVGSALSNVANGRELFHRISQVDASKYNYKRCNRQFDNLKPGKGISINTLFHIAKNNGVTLLEPISKSMCYKAKEKSKIHFATRHTPMKLKSDFMGQAGYKPARAVAAQPVQSLHKMKEPKPKHKAMVCYVGEDGKLYIPNPCGHNTFSVHKSIEQFKSGKGLPVYVDKDKVDMAQMREQML